MILQSYLSFQSTVGNLTNLFSDVYDNTPDPSFPGRVGEGSETPRKTLHHYCMSSSNAI